MTKNICFIANYYKTDLFVAIAKALIDCGLQVYWITPNTKQYKKLTKLFSSERVLYVGKKEILSSNLPEVNYDLKINELIYGDRVLKEEPEKWTFDYLLNLKKTYFKFIKDNEIRYIFGEITWAHELLAMRLVKQANQLNCKYLNPHTIRIPNGRFAFFTDEFQSQILQVNKNLTQPIHKIKAEKPTYMALNDKFIDQKSTINHNIKLLKNFIFRTNQDTNDVTLYKNPSIQFRIKTKEILNRFLFKNFISETKHENLPSNKKTLLFTLHKQPEASIDVIGRYYEDQLILIKNIWRILPQDHILLVKEHSNAIGDRGLKFYKAIKNLKNTYLVDNATNSYVFLETCEAVFTVSGTIAYEAALKGKKSYTFAPVFFNRLTNCKEISWKDFRKTQSLSHLMNDKNPLNLEEFSNWLFSNSFEGTITDVLSDPSVIEAENISKLSDAFLTVIDQ